MNLKIFEVRKTTIFEKFLLVIGIAVLVVGFYMINKVYMTDGALSWDLLQASFLWLMLFFMIILASNGQDVKEELAILIKKTNEQLCLLRKDIKKNGKKKR